MEIRTYEVLRKLVSAEPWLMQKVGRATQRFWASPADAADMMSHWAKGLQGNDDIDNMTLAISMAMVLPTKIEQWRDVWLGDIESSKRLFLISCLDDQIMPKLSQADFNFLTLADMPNRDMSISRKKSPGLNGYMKTLADFERGLATATQLKEASWADLADIEPEVKRFLEAFSEQAIREADESKYRLFGQYEMERVPLPYLDSLISYDTLRLVFCKDGARGSIVKENMYTPFAWRPERQSFWMFGAKIAWALHMLMAGIWRDACVVQEKFYTERSRKIYQPRRRASLEQKRATVLPRVVRHILWSDDQERERITHKAHAVRGFFRHLPEDWKAGDEAVDAAIKEQGIKPPQGFTYVRPHQRGGKAESDQQEIAPRKIICRGLQAARIALDWKDDNGRN